VSIGIKWVVRQKRRNAAQLRSPEKERGAEAPLSRSAVRECDECLETRVGAELRPD